MNTLLWKLSCSRKPSHVHSRGTRTISKQVYPHYKSLWPGEKGKDYLKYSCDEGDTVILIAPNRLLL